MEQVEKLQARVCVLEDLVMHHFLRYLTEHQRTRLIEGLLAGTSDLPERERIVMRLRASGERESG